ncbi:hypothetical protein AS156_37235 [Bradyrhizobium macuxiense]|uniref:Uncharacterized protein n=1 Tax=Bradyrhizobium macuxiense TaxID=1755647 RepID=A0A109JZD7_9BRAD|nr:hypothetical protein AS156_37235 [Bradyrhizobium macuxiense]
MRVNLSIVVPAKAGTHSHSRLLIDPAVAQASLDNERQWLWVRARAEPVIGRRFAPTRWLGRDDRKG